MGAGKQTACTTLWLVGRESLHNFLISLAASLHQKRLHVAYFMAGRHRAERTGTGFSFGLGVRLGYRFRFRRTANPCSRDPFNLYSALQTTTTTATFGCQLQLQLGTSVSILAPATSTSIARQAAAAVSVAACPAPRPLDDRRVLRCANRIAKKFAHVNHSAGPLDLAENLEAGLSFILGA